MPRTATRSRIELEMEISQALIRFEKEFMGRGPLETRTYLLDDLVVVRLKGVLMMFEIKLAESDPTGQGRTLLKQVRQNVLDRGRPWLEAVIQDILGVAVRSVHTDISTKTGERVVLFTLAEKPVYVSDGADGPAAVAEARRRLRREQVSKEGA